MHHVLEHHQPALSYIFLTPSPLAAHHFIPALYLLSPGSSLITTKQAFAAPKSGGVGGYTPFSKPFSNSSQERVRLSTPVLLWGECPAFSLCKPRAPASQEDICVLQHWEVCFGSLWSCGFPKQLRVKESSQSSARAPHRGCLHSATAVDI